MNLHIRSNPLATQHTTRRVAPVTGAIPALLIDPALKEVQDKLRAAGEGLVPLHVLAAVRDGQAPLSAPPAAFEMLNKEARRG